MEPPVVQALRKILSEKLFDRVKIFLKKSKKGVDRTKLHVLR